MDDDQRMKDSTHSHQNVALPETETHVGRGPRERLGGVPEQPDQIGRYQIVGVLGQGAFGTVYRGRDEELQRDVAIKVWRFDRFRGNADVEQLLEEARSVARLEKHASIVGVYDVGRQADGSCFVVLEFIEGHTLDCELKSHKLALGRAWGILIQVAAAMQHAHAAGLVHRDLKPANVLLDAAGNAHVADFGLALDEERQRFRAGEVAGTPAYMAPEQVRGEAHRLDGRSDIWALGVMFYELLTQRQPFRGKTHKELFDEILHRDPKPPRQCDPEIPPELERICLKCLAKDANARYTNAADLASDLRRWQRRSAGRQWRLAWFAGLCIGLAAAAFLARYVLTGNGSGHGPASVQRTLLFVRRGGDDHTLQKITLKPGEAAQGISLDPLQFGDDFKLQADFDRPTGWHLVWLDTKGVAQVVASAEHAEKTAEYPLGNQLVGIDPGDPVGNHLLVLLVSDRAPDEVRRELEDRLHDLGQPPVAAPEKPAQNRGAGSVQATSASLLQIESCLPQGVYGAQQVSLPTKR